MRLLLQKTKTFFVASILLCTGVSSFAEVKVLDSKIQSIPDWDYFEGDLNVDSDLETQLTSKNWKRLGVVLKPKVEGVDKNVWMRAKLPEIAPESVMNIKAIDQDYEVYFDGKMVFKHGVMGSDGKGKFIDWRPHFIPLPNNASGKYIYFRVYSNHSNIGFTGVPTVGESLPVFKELASSELGGYFIVMCLFVLSAISLTVVFGGGDFRLFLPASLVSFSGGSYLLTKTTYPFLMVPWFPWFNVELVSLAFIPVGYALYLAAVSENRMKHILSNLSKFNLSIAALSIIFGFVELIHLKDFLLFIQLGALITLGFSLVALVKSMLLGRKSSKIIFVGTVVAGVGIIHDILLSINVIESTLLLGNIAGLFLFSSMSIAAGVEYKESFVRARKLQAEREKQKAKSLKDRMEAIANLAAGVAHEINNPLAIIQASAYKIDREVKLSGEEVLIDTGKTYMKKIKSSIDRIHGITQSLVLVSKDSDDGQVQVPLSVVITKPMEDAKVMAADLGVKLFSNNFPGDVYIQCMLSYLEKAFTGLLLNAVEAASSTDEKWVKIEFHKGEEDVQIRIIDSGKGIPPKVLEKIFQPFYTSKDIGSGVGMGLSIASRIIKNLKGNLWVDDMAPNTTFVIDLPAVVAKKKKKKSDNNVHVNYIDKAS